MSTFPATSGGPSPAGPYSHRYQEDAPPQPGIQNVNTGAHVGNSPLCSRCRDFDIQTFTTSPTHTRGYLLSDVEAATARGCEFCTLLFDAVKYLERPKYYSTSASYGPNLVKRDLYIHMTLSQNYESVNARPTTKGLSINRMRVELGDRFNEMRNASDYELCLAADPQSPAATNGDVTGRYLGRDPESAEVFRAINRWIENCSTHAHCSTVPSSSDDNPVQSPLPSRCIEIADGGRLVLRERSDDMRGPYITVTHRWNQGTEDCKTTMDNYEARLAGRGFGRIPKLFEDVFTVSRKMNVRLVWIDSICIIQSGDGGNDWRKEAPMMSQYYQNSLFTIAGTMTDMENGILCPYPEDAKPWGSNLVRLPYMDPSGSQVGHFYVYKRHPRLVDDYWSSVRNSLLFRRGWILQEWLLSKRFLWYTSNGIFLECRSETPQTLSGEKIQLDMAQPDLRSYLQLKLAFHFTNSSALDIWYKALDIYSECQLTKPDLDRILAVAGIAKEVHQILARPQRGYGMMGQMAIYLAGLWLGDIHHGLLWEADGATRPLTQRIDQIPSWSWAHIMTHVKWPERGKKTDKEMKVLGFSFTARGSNEQPEYVLLPQTVRLLPEFNPGNMTACLHLRGRLSLVHVRGYLTTKEDLETASLFTAYGIPPTSHSWRAICSPARPEVAAGWGSLESLMHGEGTCADFGVAILALHVSTRYRQAGWLIQRSNPVLDVLFLEGIDGGNKYRRLGVGRIADIHLIADFLQVEEEDIQLI